MELNKKEMERKITRIIEGREDIPSYKRDFLKTKYVQLKAKIKHYEQVNKLIREEENSIRFIIESSTFEGLFDQTHRLIQSCQQEMFATTKKAAKVARDSDFETFQKILDQKNNQDTTAEIRENELETYEEPPLLFKLWNMAVNEKLNRLTDFIHTTMKLDYSRYLEGHPLNIDQFDRLNLLYNDAPS